MASGCQVAFYVLESDSQSPEQVACWLAIKAWEQGHRVAIRSPDAAQAQALDELMWEFPEGRFVPHQQGADSTAPVAIATAAETPAAGRTVMINLDASPVPQPGDFERLLEIVPALEKHRLASREKFRAYRGQGLEPTTLPLTKS